MEDENLTLLPSPLGVLMLPHLSTVQLINRFLAKSVLSVYAIMIM